MREPLAAPSEVSHASQQQGSRNSVLTGTPGAKGVGVPAAWCSQGTAWSTRNQAHPCTKHNWHCINHHAPQAHPRTKHTCAAKNTRHQVHLRIKHTQGEETPGIKHTYGEETPGIKHSQDCLHKHPEGQQGKQAHSKATMLLAFSHPPTTTLNNTVSGRVWQRFTATACAAVHCCDHTARTTQHAASAPQESCQGQEAATYSNAVLLLGLTMITAMCTHPSRSARPVAKRAHAPKHKLLPQAQHGAAVPWQNTLCTPPNNAFRASAQDTLLQFKALC